MLWTRRSALFSLTATATIGFIQPNFAAESATIAYGGLDYIWSLMFVAEANHVWETFGISAVPVDFPTGREAMQAVLGGSAQFATAADTPVAFAGLQGLQPLVLASFSRDSRDMAIMMGPKSGVDPNDPSSLKGKTIATIIGTSGQYLLSRYLQMAGLKDSDVKIVNLSPANMVPAVMHGSVDGFAWDIQLSTQLAAASDNKSVVMTQKGIEKVFVINQLLLTNRPSYDAHPNLMVNAARVLMKAEEIMSQEHDWPKSVAARLHSDPDTIAKRTSVFQFKVELNQEVLDNIVRQAEWAIETGLVKDPGKDVRTLFRGLMVPKPLQTVAPDRVNL